LAPSKKLHTRAKAKRVIYLFQSGAPSHIDLFDPNQTQDLTAPNSPKPFAATSAHRHDQRPKTTSRRWLALRIQTLRQIRRRKISELLPHTAKIVDDICLIRTMSPTLNHEPAVTFFATGNQPTRRPTWAHGFSYGLGRPEPQPPRLRRPRLRGAANPSNPVIGATAPAR